MKYENHADQAPTKRYDEAIDWDDTLVDARTGAWLDGAREYLGKCVAAGLKVTIHSCRANFVEGENQIRQRLIDAGLDHHVDIWMGRGKPDAKRYIDNLGYRFPGSWATFGRVI